MSNILKVVRVISEFTKTGNDDIIHSFLNDRTNNELIPIYNKLNGIVQVFSSQGTWAGLKNVGKELGKGALALVKAHPVITALAAAFAAYKVADKFIFTYDEDLEKAQKALSDYQSTQQEIESVNNELSTTSARMDELLAKDSLTLVEKDELAKLQRSNDELERRAKKVYKQG